MASAVSAVKLDGRKGRHEQFLNGVYDPVGQLHNDRPVWVSRAAQACYLFHTGKTRWVVSKRVDDGARCYGFVEDAGTDIMQCKGAWVCCDNDGEWRADTSVHLTGALASNDPFVALRMTLDTELEKYGLHSVDRLKELWKVLDFNGNSIVSLAEIDKLVVQMVSGGQWPSWLNNKPALMRAYKKTTLREGNGDDWVQKGEFADLLLNLFWFNKLFVVFNEMAGDRRMDVREFQAGLSKLGLRLDAKQAQEEFRKMDKNGGGQVLFVEFCGYIRDRINPDHNKAFDSDIVSGEQCGKVMRRSYGNRGTHTHYVAKKTMSDFNDLEQKIKGMLSSTDPTQMRDLWKRIDFNGNNLVSLAELDKLVVEAYPLLNHKPALMRSYKMTTVTGDGDDWVEKHEFKSLLANLFYFNKLFWLFEEVGDGDRRMNFEEFRRMLTLTKVSMTEAQAQQEFGKIDKNGGGMVLFDEFCTYFTAKACPEAMTAFVDQAGLQM